VTNVQASHDVPIIQQALAQVQSMKCVAREWVAALPPPGFLWADFKQTAVKLDGGPIQSSAAFAKSCPTCL
jgi:hypothetical protein